MTDMQTRLSAVPPVEAALPTTVVSALVQMFSRLGVKQAFGVSGGAMAALWDALSSSSLGVYHFRHETGAAFAAIEACFAGGRPTLLFTTTGPVAAWPGFVGRSVPRTTPRMGHKALGSSVTPRAAGGGQRGARPRPGCRR